MRTTSPRSRRVYCGPTGPLFLAVELSTAEWRSGVHDGVGATPIEQRVIPAGDRERLRRVLADAKRRCGLAATAPVRSCYEAGRDAFWPHRLLEAEGVDERGGGFVEHRGVAAGAPREDGPAGCAQAGDDAGAVDRSGTRQVWHVVHVPAAGRRKGSSGAADPRDAHRRSGRAGATASTRRWQRWGCGCGSRRHSRRGWRRRSNGMGRRCRRRCGSGCWWRGACSSRSRGNDARLRGGCRRSAARRHRARPRRCAG